MLLFRPVGLEELHLVYDAGMRAFPPRLPDQPIFYPVLNEDYAAQIARDWNTKTGTRAGFVTRFEVDDGYAGGFERHVVGSREHEELWVPAEDLDAFNSQIRNPIVVTKAFFGDDYQGLVPDSFGLRGKNARQQFVALAKTLPYSGMDFVLEIAANHRAVYLNFSFWAMEDFAADGIDASEKARVLDAIHAAWRKGEHAEVPLAVERRGLS